VLAQGQFIACLLSAKVTPYFMACFRLCSRSPASLLALAASLILSACGGDSTDVEILPGIQITVTPGELILRIGAKASLAAAVSDLEDRTLAGREIRWSSSAPDIVAVSAAGEVTALDAGTASIAAYSEQSVGFARIVVQPDLGSPLRNDRRWLVLGEIGTSAPECADNEGGRRVDGGHDCSHAGVSRYSLDFADVEQWDGSLSGAAPAVVAAADGIITDVCLQPPTEVTCGPNGPFLQVEHRGGFLSIYAHLDPASVTLLRKATVTQGQRLGSMGSWGSDRAPWLHFELRYEKQGAQAASVLDAIELNGRKLGDYKAGQISEG
jgi:hypothetical protein